MDKITKCLAFLAFVFVGCSGSSPRAVDAGPFTEGGVGRCVPTPGAPGIRSVVNGHFDNGIFSGFLRAWKKNTTSVSSIALACQDGGACTEGAGMCAQGVLEGIGAPLFVPSYLEPGVTLPQVGLGLDINQAADRGSPPVPWCPSGDGLYVSFKRSEKMQFILQLTAQPPSGTGAGVAWCFGAFSTSATDLRIRWEDFARCDGTRGVSYSPAQAITAIDFFLEPSDRTASRFDLCVRDVAPFGLPSEIISCEDWYRYPIPGSRNVLINNVWNAQRAGSAPHSQCLRRRATATGEQFGWTWSWPEVVMDTSYAAPEVVFGRKPWDGGESTTPDLPKRMDEIQSLAVDFDIQIAARQSYNLNTTLWLTRTQAASTAPDPENILAEVMVRFSNPLGIDGGTISDGEVTLDGIPFTVTHQDAHADASGGSRYTWKMVVYEAVSPTTAARFDLALVLRDMLAKGLASPENGVQGVELITEVSGDEGEVWLNRFEVTVR